MARQPPRFPGGPAPSPLAHSSPAVVEDWATQWTTTQGAPFDLVVGLDFGTAFTKCIVRAPNSPGAPAFVIPLGSGASVTRFLLPSTLYSTKGGTFSLEPSDGATAFNSLKSPLVFEGGCSQRQRAHIVAYIALVLRRVRRAMIEGERAFLGTRRIRWSLNLGLPAASHDCDDLEALYRDIARLAWTASTRPGAISEALCGELEHSGADLSCEIEIVPEVAAAVTAYARSRQRRDGLHFLVDVGAGTFDACVFRLHDDTGDRVSIFQACVKPLGVLAHERDPLLVQEQAGLALREVLWTTKTRRDPGAREWADELRYFMAGGGRDLPAYRAAIPGKKNGRSWEVMRFVEVDSAAGKGLRPAVDRDLFRRLIVACGLSYEAPNIARIDKPHTIEDAAAPVRRSSWPAPNRFSSGANQEDDD